MEQWKKIEDDIFNFISISNTGRLRNDETGHIYTLRVQPKTGLAFCDVSKVDQNEVKHRKTLYIAYEVANAFVKKPDDFHKVTYKAIHKKGKSKLSNLPKNLEWKTQSEISAENIKDSPHRNFLAKYNKNKFKDYPKKKYVPVAEREKKLKNSAFENTINWSDLPIKYHPKPITRKEMSLMDEIGVFPKPMDLIIRDSDIATIEALHDLLLYGEGYPLNHPTLVKSRKLTSKLYQIIGFNKAKGKLF